VSLFSQLVAGPIIRFKEVQKDFEGLGTAHPTRWLGRGASLLVIGMVEKVLIADSLAAYVDPALARYESLSSGGAWLVMLGYTFQLYFDFSGYSTMAVGLGYLFGIRIPQNFDSPYKALDPSDFWRRWHISLSRCMRDYLYIPFGGNRHGQLQTHRNLMLTMLIGGLWHGAAWTFVVWGGYHGLLLILYRRFARHWDAVPASIRQVCMFLLVVVGWVFFRSKNFSMAAALLRAMFLPTPGMLVPQLALVAFALTVAAWWSMVGPNSLELKLRWGWRGAAVITMAFGACVAIIAGSRPSPFLYFQF
jgi:alginate O-acetyltransferase complex protein AlgI